MVHLGSLVIRQAREQDYEKIDKMFRAYAPRDQDRMVYKILELIEPNSIRIATEGGQPVGCCYGHFHDGGTGIISGLFLIRRFQGSSVAEALVKACVENLRSQGCSELMASCKIGDPTFKTLEQLGFRKWRWKAWGFFNSRELMGDRSSEIKMTESAITEARSFLSGFAGRTEFLPVHFWLRRFTDSYVDEILRTNRFIFLSGMGEASIAIWNDVPALKVTRGDFSSYFMFHRKCHELNMLGSPSLVREISIIYGHQTPQVLNQIARDAYREGVNSLLIHNMGDDDMSLMNDRKLPSLWGPRIVLRSSLGHSLDDYLHPLAA